MKFTCFGSTLNYPHKEFLISRPPRTRSKYNLHPSRSKFNPHPHAKQCGFPHPPRKCGYPQHARVNPPREGLYCIPRFPLILAPKFHSLYIKESESEILESRGGIFYLRFRNPACHWCDWKSRDKIHGYNMRGNQSWSSLPWPVSSKLKYNRKSEALTQNIRWIAKRV